MTNTYPKGTCEQMCPKSEIIFREKQGLIHILEVLEGTKNVADKNKMVKEFSRSAAGRHSMKPEELRTVNALLLTVHYLLHDVVNTKTVPWNVVYDFIMDRFRAVRQDIVIQSVDRPDTICILQPIVKFYAYAAYRLCEESIDIYDPVINKKHLLECLKRLLCLYDDSDVILLKYCKFKQNYDSSVKRTSFDKTRMFMECLYLIVNLGHIDAIERALRLKSIFKSDKLEFCLKLSIDFRNGNYVRVVRNIKKLSGLLLANAVLHLPHIRKNCLHMMSVAYNSKNLQFPCDTLANILFYENMKNLIHECRYFGLTITPNGVEFVKNNFNCNKSELPTKHFQLVDDNLRLNDLSSLFLTDDL